MGCSRSGENGTTAIEARAMGTQTCAACGMVVREQPAPRGQVLHRDGTNPFFCSLGDMLHYLKAPSPHGRVTGVFVEVLDPNLDPMLLSSSPRPWLTADQAAFVVGFPREGFMGPPLLAYEKRTDAEAAAKHGARVTDWRNLADEVEAIGARKP